MNAVYISDLAAWCGISFNNEVANPLCYDAHLYLDDNEVTDLIIPEGLTTIGKCSFSGCGGLTSVTIPNSVTKIDDYALSGCYGVTSVTIGSNVRTIGRWAFEGCQKLMDIYCYAEDVPNVLLDAFSRIKINNVTLHVPAPSVSAYQAAEPWNQFGAIVPLETEPAYRPLVEEGKHWTYSNYMPVRPAEYNHYYSYDLKGDTLIAGKNCLKMYSDNRANDGVVRYEAALYEEDKKVFCFFPEKEEAVLLYDFGCEVGDTLNVYETKMVVTDIQPVIPGDVVIRKYILQPVWDEPEDYGEVFWIEGVGATMDFFGMLPKPGNYNSLYACELNGEDLLPEPAYRPFIEEGKVWKVGGDEAGNPVRRVEYYYFDGDTIIDGKTCKQMMCQRYVSPEHPDYTMFSQMPSLGYVGAWYEEDRKVYVYDDTNKQFQLMYDFSLEANDTLQIDVDCPLYVVGPRQTGGVKGFKGVYRNVMTIWSGEQNIYYNTTWLEGVGNIDGPIYSIYYGKEGHALFLMSCTVGDEIIYLNDDYEDGATPDIRDAQNRRIDFTHTIKTKPKAPIKREAEQSVYGEYNELRLNINLDLLADAYQVSLADEAGKVVYEKAIDAADIVGLIIDISAYAEGLYTITVENSQESFTGAFEVQTTGIASPESSPEGKGTMSPLLQEGTGEAFDLFGRPACGTKKGIYIQNRKKVLVK